MLDQVIFTRCMPSRDLLGNGEVQPNDGYGVFSMSRELFGNLDRQDREYLKARLTDYSGAQEGAGQGLFRSYEYVVLPSGKGALISVVKRSRREADDSAASRKNRQFRDFLAFFEQAVTGDFSTYAFQWFDSRALNAHELPPHAYYLDGVQNPEPAFLPQIDEREANAAGDQMNAKLAAFIGDGRAEAAAKALWFLLREFDREETERRILLIRDEPENVGLWVAAILSTLPVRLAKEISFSTNRTGLNKGVEGVLFRAPDGAGQTGRMPAGRGVPAAGGKIPVNMIAGYHPADKMCGTVRQMPSSRFVLLDGMQKKLMLETDDSAGDVFYRDAFSFSGDYLDFRNVVLESLPLSSPTAGIAGLYAAYRYLLDEKQDPQAWTYEEACRQLDELSKYGMTGNAQLTAYILERFASVYGCGLIGPDSRNRYQLLGKLDRYAAGIGRQGMSEELFSNDKLVLYAGKLPACDTDTVMALADLYLRYASAAGKPNETFVYYLAASVRQDRNALTQLLGRLGSFPGLAGDVVFAAAQNAQDPGPTKDLWEALVESGAESPDRIYRRAAGMGMPCAQLEEILAACVRREGRLTAETAAAAKELVTQNRYAGQGVELLRSAAGVTERRNLGQVIALAASLELPPESAGEVIRIIDNSFSADEACGVYKGLIGQLDQYALPYGIRSRNGELCGIHSVLSGQRTPQEILNGLGGFVCRPVGIDQAFVQSRYLDEICAYAARQCDPRIHLAFISMFASPDRSVMDGLMKKYVHHALLHAKGRNMTAMLDSLGETINIRYDLQGLSEERGDLLCEQLGHCFEAVLPDHFKNSFYDDLEKAGEMDPSVYEYLTGVFDRISGTKGGKETGFKGMLKGFGGLFGKKGK